MQHLEIVRMVFFNLKLQQRVTQKGISLAELARWTGTCYENLRKLLRGDFLPSAALLARLCSTLQLNRKEMQERVRKDRIVFRFGESGWSYLGFTPRLGELEILFSVATSEQQEFMALWITSYGDAKKRMQRNATTGAGEGQVGHATNC